MSWIRWQLGLMATAVTAGLERDSWLTCATKLRMWGWKRSFILEIHRHSQREGNDPHEEPRLLPEEDEELLLQEDAHSF